MLEDFCGNLNLKVANGGEEGFRAKQLEFQSPMGVKGHIDFIVYACLHSSHAVRGAPETDTCPEEDGVGNRLWMHTAQGRPSLYRGALTRNLAKHKPKNFGKNRTCSVTCSQIQCIYLLQIPVCPCGNTLASLCQSAM